MRDTRHYWNRTVSTTTASRDPTDAIDLAAHKRIAHHQVGDALRIKYLSSRHGRVIDRVGTVTSIDRVEDEPALGNDGDLFVTVRCKERRDRTRSLVVNGRTGRVTSNGFYIGPLVDVEFIECPERVREAIREQVRR